METIVSKVDATSSILVPRTSPISVLGLYPQKWRTIRSTLPSPLQASLFRGTLFSEAPLEKVEHALTFLDTKTRFCVGILLKYQNGAQRALGQCRVGIDMVHYCETPAYILYAPSTYSSSKVETKLRSVKVQFERVYTGVSQPRWTRSEMEGIIQMWFNARQTILRVVGNEH